MRLFRICDNHWKMLSRWYHGIPARNWSYVIAIEIPEGLFCSNYSTEWIYGLPSLDVGIAVCRPEDRFNVDRGMILATQRLRSISVGLEWISPDIIKLKLNPYVYMLVDTINKTITYDNCSHRFFKNFIKEMKEVEKPNSRAEELVIEHTRAFTDYDRKLKALEVENQSLKLQLQKALDYNNDLVSQIEKLRVD